MSLKRRSWTRSNQTETLVGTFEVKARDESSRTFVGDLSTSHLDLGDHDARDIVHPGAFKRWLDHFKRARDPYVPLLNSHDRWSIFSILGHMLDGEEKLTGNTLTYDLEDGETLEVEEMRLSVEWQVIDGQDGDRVLDRLRPGSVRNMSMGYDPKDFDFDRLADGTKLRNLREVKVEEGSLVVFGMNPYAQANLETVKRAVEGIDPSDLSDEDRAELEGLRAKIDRLMSGTGTDEPPAADPATVEALTKRIDSLRYARLDTRITRLVTRDVRP